MARPAVVLLWVTALLCALVSLGGPAAPPATAAVACPSGFVRLTFDDGPKVGVTGRLVDILRDRHVPATFFVVGAKVAANPALTRRASRLGFAIGNHTYRHERLTRLTNAEVERTLRRTRQAVVAAGAQPSVFMRPPYGEIDSRVRAVVDGLGLVPVLWTVDPRDWDGKSASQITTATLSRLSPGGRNLVLLHDGVRNSPNTLLAVPRIIRGARERGYCFAGLGG